MYMCTVQDRFSDIVKKLFVITLNSSVISFCLFLYPYTSNLKIFTNIVTRQIKCYNGLKWEQMTNPEKEKVLGEGMKGNRLYKHKIYPWWRITHSYRKNLNFFLLSLAAYVIVNGEYYTATIGKDADKVYGLMLSKEDTSPEFSCVNFTIHGMMINCSNKKKVIAWAYMDFLCIIRYSASH